MRKMDWALLLVVLLPLVVALPTWGAGVAHGADATVHIHRAHALALAMREGDFYPRWISYLHLGYGYPIFNFYTPVYLYPVAFLDLLGLPIHHAYNLVQTLAWLLGGIGMYRLAQRFLPNSAAVLASALWIYAPSRLYEVWWQGSLAQIIGAAFIPFLMLALVDTIRTPTLRQSVKIALAFTAIVFSHTPMMYISLLFSAGLCFLAPLGLYWRNRANLIKCWFYLGCGFVLALGLSMIFLLPVFLELRYVTIAGGLDETVNYLKEQFIALAEILSLPPILDRSDTYLNLPRSLGLVGAVLSLLGFIAALRRKRYGFALLTSIGLGFTVFMLLDASLPLWLALPKFADLRFPARFLRMGAVLIALLGGGALVLIPKRLQALGFVLLIGLVIAQIVPILRPYDDWLVWDSLSAVDEIQYEASSHTWGTVSYDEFNPVWGERIALDVPWEIERYAESPFHLRVYEPDEAETNWQGLISSSLSADTLDVHTDRARPVRFRQYYFPGWQVWVDGELVESYPDEEIGLITVDLTAGEHRVQLRYSGTGVQALATGISFLSAVLCLGLWYFGKHQPLVLNTSEDTFVISPRFAIMISAVLLSFTALNQFVLLPNHAYMRQSPPDAPVSMTTPVHALFGGELELLGYRLQQRSISPNSPLQIDLYWRAPQGTSADYRPLVQLVNLSQSAAWAVSDPLQPSAGKTSSYLPERFARDIHNLQLLNADIPPFVGQIRIQVLGENGALTLPDGSDALLLGEHIAIETANVQATNHLQYQLGAVASLDCASIKREGDALRLDLIWKLYQPSSSDLALMVQGLDANGALVGQADGAPFNGDYPTNFWRSGQVVHEQRFLPDHPDYARIALAFYERESLERLPVTLNGERVADDRIDLALEEQRCLTGF